MPKPATLGSEYRDFFQDLRNYWSGYGGLRKIVFSPYTHIAIFITFLCWGLWHSHDWTVAPLAVLPALLGFTLAAYALLLGFGDEKFRKFLAVSVESRGAPDRSLAENTLIGVSAIFLHFVVIEIIALVLAIIGSSNPLTSLGMSSIVAMLLQHFGIPNGTPHVVVAAFGVFFFVLSILMALAAAIDIFHATGWYVKYSNVVSKQ